MKQIYLRISIKKINKYLIIKKKNKLIYIKKKNKLIANKIHYNITVSPKVYKIKYVNKKISHKKNKIKKIIYNLNKKISHKIKKIIYNLIKKYNKKINKLIKP